MSRVSFFDNIFLSGYTKFFKGVYGRNKKLLAVSTIMFFAPLFIGAFIGYFLPHLVGSFLIAFTHQLKSQVELTTVSIFTHNLQAALVAYIGGIIGIVPALTLFSNGFLIGSLSGYLMNGTVHQSLSLVDVISYILPHGIFEIPAFIIAGAAGFRLTSVVIDLINSTRGKPYISDDYRKFKDSLALLAIAVILLVIAAIIEANFTIPIGNYITGLNLH